MRSVFPWLWERVPGLGTVVFSPAAMRALVVAAVDVSGLSTVLSQGRDVRNPLVVHGGHREHSGVRLVLRTHPALPGAAVVCVGVERVDV